MLEYSLNAGLLTCKKLGGTIAEMAVIKVASFPEFHEIVTQYGLQMIFRGVSRMSYKLVPKAGRDRYAETMTVAEEQRLLQAFQNDAMPFLNSVPQSQWEWWAIAQHHGLPTRFLDWTQNPLVAAYFAVEDCNGIEDCVVYACDNTQFNSIIDLSDNPDPLGIEEIFLYNPPHITQRITAQRGLFTVHNNPSTPLAETSFPEETIVASNGTMAYYAVDTIVIKKEFKKEFKRILSLYGWNQATIYPGLDGITSHLDWLMTEAR